MSRAEHSNVETKAGPSGLYRPFRHLRSRAICAMPKCGEREERSRCLHPARSGFSLIEATIAVAIVALLTVATSSMLSRLPVSARDARDQALALTIAESELENLRALGYESLPASGAFSHTLLSSLASSSAARTVTDYSSSTKRVSVELTWVNGTLTRSLSLTTLIAENSLLP